MKLPFKPKYLNFRKGSEKGSVTLFVLIAMLFFLMIGMMIFIINMNAETAQKRDVEKIKSEYSANTNETDLEQMYQEAKQRQMGTFFIKLIDKFGVIYNSGEWVNETWLNSENYRLPLTVEPSFPAGLTNIDVTVRDDINGGNVVIKDTNTIKQMAIGTKSTTTDLLVDEGQYTITNNIDSTNEIKVKIDVTKPVVNTISGGEVWIVPDGTDTTLDVSITATDPAVANGKAGSGMEGGKIEYAIGTTAPDGNTTWSTYTGAIKVESSLGEGDYYIYARATDLAGNISEIATSGVIQVRTANYKITTGTDTRYSETLADAIYRANQASTTTESTIQVLRAVNDNSEATIDKTITLDTNGKTVTMANTITVAKNKTATFVDTATTKGKLQRTTGKLITNNGTVTVNGATVESTDMVIHGGTVNVSSGIVNNSETETNATSRAIQATNVNISGGTVSCSASHSIVSTGLITITGGTVSSRNGIAPLNGTLTVSGGTVNGTNQAIYFNSAQSPSINISGGIITGGDCGIAGSVTTTGTTGRANITITGGTVTGATDGIKIGCPNTTLTIGESTNALNKETPVITGTNGYSVNIESATSTFNFYDGKLIGGTKALASEEKRTFFGREMSFNLANDTTANFYTETEGNATRRYLPYTRENDQTHKFETVLEKEVKVTFDKNAEDATCTETERNVLTNVEYKELAGTAQNDTSVTYSNLPRQTGLENETDSKIDRTGYTFKGWQTVENLIPDSVDDWEQGAVNIAGELSNSSTRIRLKNYLKIAPNTKYTITTDNSQQLGVRMICLYDKNLNYQSNAQDLHGAKNISFTSGSNSAYILVALMNNNGTENGGDISVNDIQNSGIYMTAEVTDTTKVTQDTDHTLKAIWEANKYTVHFDGDGATGGTMADQEFEYDEEKALTQNAFTREHTVTYDGNEGTASKANDTATYTFTNWGNKDILGYDLDMSVGNVRQDNIIGNENGYKTLTNTTGSNTQKDFARWTILPTFNPGDKYKVTFYAKGTRGALGADLGIFFYGATDYLQCTKVECSNGAGNTRADGYMGLLLTDKWTKYTVTWTLGSNGDGNVNKYLMFRVYSEANASIYGVRFEKLENEEHADQEVVSNLTSDPNGTVTLYAVWTPHEVTLPSATREGYIFNGWYDATTGGNKIGNAGDKYIPEANITLHAQWRQVHYTVSVGEETLPAETLAEAVGLAEERITGSVTTATITALMNYTDNSTATISKNITIDTNGHEITMANTITVAANTTATFVDTATTKGKLIRTAGKLITNSGTVKIGTNNTDGTDMDSVDRVVSGGDVEVNSGILNLTGAGELDTNFAVISAVNITVNGGQIINDYMHYGLLTYAQASVIDLNGGMIRAQGCGINSYATLNMSGTTQINGETGIITYNNNTTFNITGGTINASNNGIYNSKNGTINVSGGTITGGTHGIYNAANGTINVSGATTSITGTSSQGIRGYTGNVTISGGTIHGNTHGISVNADTLNSGSILMTGGTVESAYYGLLAAGNSTITMGANDGTVSKETPEVISNATSGDYNGVYRNTTATFNFYDGKVTCYTEHSLNAAETSKPDGYQVVKRTADGRETAVLEKELTVTFEPNPGNTTGATVNPTSKTVLTNTAYGELPTPTKTGYSFKEWQTADNLISTNPNDWQQGAINDAAGINGSDLSTRIRTKDYIRVSPNTKYRLSVNNSNNIVIRLVWFYDNDKAFISTNGNEYYVDAFEFTTPSNCHYIRTVLQYGYAGTTDITPSNVTDANIHLTETVTDSTLVTQESNHTLNAIWEANPYTVTADANGGSITATNNWTGNVGDTTATKSVTFDTAYGTLPEVSRTGYTFDKWTGKNLLNLQVPESTPSDTTKNNTTARKFEFNTYIKGIAYNNYYVNDNVGSVTINQNSIKVNAKNGYGAGYALKVNKNTNYVLSYDADGANSVTSIIYYNENGEMISYERTNGNGTKNVQFTTPNDIYYLVVVFSVEKGEFTEYTFSNIMLEEGSTATSYEPYKTITAESLLSTDCDHKIYAQWTPITYNITYNMNGGTNNASNPSTYTIETPTFNLQTPTRDNFTFFGWEVNEGTSVLGSILSQTPTVTINNGTYTFTNATEDNRYTNTKLQLYSSTQSIILQLKQNSNLEKVYGIYDHKLESGVYRLKFAANGSRSDGYVFYNVNLEQGKKYYYQWENTKATDQEYVVNNFKFVEATGNTSVSIPQGSYGDKEFTAYWYANQYTYREYTATFDVNGGNELPEADRTRTLQYATPLGELPTTTKTGYDLAGWFTAATGGTEITAETKMGAANVTYYAHWTAKQYTVSFDANTGTGGQSEAVTATYDSAMPAISTTAPTKRGYTFMGWYDNADYTQGTQYYTAEGESTRTWDKTADTTLYAGWQINQYTLTVDPNGGTWNGQTTATTVTQNYGTTYNVANNATKEGYVFGGWQLVDGNGNRQNIDPNDSNIKYFDDSNGSTQLLKQYIINETSTQKPGVYNNNLNGAVTFNKISDATSPTGYSLEIKTDGTASPSAGGFVNANNSIAGTFYYHKIIAKVPKGYTLNIASNTTGVGYGNYWLTSNTGTGEWRTYIYVQYTGYNKPFSSLGHVYLFGTNNKSVTWWLQESSVYKIANNLTELQATNVDYTFTDSNQKLIAVWRASGSRLTFDIQGGTYGNGTIGTEWTSKSKDYRYDTAYPNAHEVPYYTSDSDFAIYKTGYTLDGWYTEPNGQGTKLFDANGRLIPNVSGYTDANRTWKYYASSFTIYANWVANNYTVQANLNGGTISSAEGWDLTGEKPEKTVTYDSAYGTLPSVSRTGYTFKGWSLLPAGYEQVEYINFNGSQYIDTAVLTKQSLIVEAEFSTTTKSKTFFGGRTSTGANSLVFGYFDNNSSYVGFGKDTTIYSTTINPIDGNKHKVILSNDIYQIDGTDQTINNRSTLTQFNNIYLGTWNNNGSADSRMYIGKIYSFIVYDGPEIVRFMIPCVNKSTGKAGFYDLANGVFYGKTTGDDFTYGNKAYLTSDTIVRIASDHTITANWEANNYTVTADLNGGTVTSADGWDTTGAQPTKSVTYDSAYGTLPTVTKAGYTFDKWTGKNMFDEETLLMAIDGATKENGYYVFDPSKAHLLYSRINGTEEIDPGFKENTQYTLSIKGYTDYVSSANVYQTVFIGFVYTDGTYSSITISGETEVLKTFVSSSGKTVEKISISFGRYNANAHIKYIQVEEGTTATSYEPYKTITAESLVATDCNHTIHANWTANPYTVTADAMGGTIPSTDGWTNAAGNGSATKEVTYDSTYGTLPTPTKDGNVFAGWYKENTFVNKVETSTQVTTDSNHTIYAKWINFTLSKNPLYMNKTTTGTAILAPQGTEGAAVTYSGNNIGELTFESQDTSVVTVSANGANTQATITTAAGAQNGNTTKVIIKDRTTGETIGELTVIIDTEPPTWIVHLLGIE
ncbi:MAG: InlB B-repeat-containing protein [Clostridia bacterium]|nr:InlB B-repeat-containing protein [Clostridia bacterium]